MEKQTSNRKAIYWENADMTIRSRLDKIYISEDLVEETKAEIKTCPYSDHNMVMHLSIVTPTPPNLGEWWGHGFSNPP